MTLALRVFGWLCMAAGALVALYLVYSLLFTNLQAEQAQEDLLESWELEVGEVARADPVGATPASTTVPADTPSPETQSPPPALGEAVAVLQFVRPGSGTPVVSAEPLFVVEGVGTEELKRGPGRYPRTTEPGQIGNFAVAGHRTTYGAPFFNLDELITGDEVLVTGRDGQQHRYRVFEQRVVSPGENSVTAPAPLGEGRALLTMTTCNPRFSNAQRLIVFAELMA